MLQSGRAHYYYHLRAVQLQAEKYYVMGEKIANINALRIQKRYEGQGHISKLMQEMEQFAIRNHLSRLTIGVEAKETRTLAIYLHLGFTKFYLQRWRMANWFYISVSKSLLLTLENRAQQMINA